MAFGFGVLRLAPAHFWSLTPRELAHAVRGYLGLSASGGSMTRRDLDALSRRFPDR
ncbi:MAG: phage tail assembly chaperone [Hyphomicrobiaceae bacterium]